MRSPLTTIISGLEVAEAHPDLLDAELAVNTLLPEAQRMHTLIDDLLLLARADRGRVFERFVRLDSDRARSGGGTGLGLAIVAEVVAAHGGTVAIDDPPSGGTKMIVTLPVSQHSNR